jgi:Ca-activated chloride channel family protein
MGITSTEELEKLVSAKKKSGIYLSVLGFGHDGYNDAILETIADKGNGNYTIIDSLKQAKKTLVDEFYCTMNTVATDVKFQVAFDKTMIDSYRLIGYENRALANEDFDDDTKDAGEIGSGQTVTIMYEINTNEVTSLKDAMTLNIRYKDSVNAKSQKVAHPIDCTKSVAPSTDFQFTSAVASLCMVLNDSQYAGKMDIKTVESMLDNIESGDEEKLELLQLVKKTVRNTYNSRHIKYMPEVVY